MELCQQVTKETSPVEHDIPFSEHIMEEELRVHFRAPPHLPASDGNTDPSEHIRKFESTTLLHRYTDGRRLSRPWNAYNLRKIYL